MISAMASEEVLGLPEVTGEPGRRRRPKFRYWRGVVLLVAGAYFLIPIYAGLKFSFQDDSGHFSFYAVEQIPSQTGFSAAFFLSIRLAVVATVLAMVLMVPTAVYVHLRLPKVRRVLDFVTILPIVIPPIVLTVGVLQVFPIQLKATMWLLGIEYVILAMPFAYRAIDAGLRSIDLKTLTEASNNLGASWVSTIWRVVLPNLGTSLLSATVLIVALCLGEFTMASLNLVTTFPVWIVQTDQLNANISVSASIIALVVTWLFLMLIVTIGSRRGRRTGAGEVNLFSVTANTKTIGES
jgi:putative spermidine/putrescine transport system permease protein